jgi:acetyl-CoA carboxylase carboxyltransferase component
MGKLQGMPATSRSATYFEVDEVIDPADSRRWISTALLEAEQRPAHAHKWRPNIDTG